MENICGISQFGALKSKMKILTVPCSSEDTTENSISGPCPRPWKFLDIFSVYISEYKFPKDSDQKGSVPSSSWTLNHSVYDNAVST